MSRKRDRTHFSRHVPYSFQKRRRRLQRAKSDLADDHSENSSSKSPATVVVIGLSPDCSVLDLKARFEIYGSISRTRVDPAGGALAYVTFRSKESADSAIAASLEASFGITLNSKRVQVMWASNTIPQWGEGVATTGPSSSSKLLRAEVPLSKHGRGKKLGSAIVNPGDKEKNNGGSPLDVPFKGREIVAYDDIL